MRILFTHFCYSFGGKNYIQQQGFPIGARVTMAAARIVMQDWSEKYHQILLNIGLQPWLFTGYVDDGRQTTNNLKPGTRFVEEEKQFRHTLEWEQEDREANVSNTKRMSIE